MTKTHFNEFLNFSVTPRLRAEALRCASATPHGTTSSVMICMLTLAFTATFCTLPLFLNASLPQSQDMTYHIFQSDQFLRNLNSGVLYPRWASGAVNGYGSPNFIFYSPFSYYFVALIHLLNSSLVSSMAVAIWFSFFLSGVTMHLLSNAFFPRYQALVPAILYQILPFHMYELYLRGSFAALFAYIWFPLVILLIYKLCDTEKSALAMAGLSFAFAALIITHLASAFMFSIIISLILLAFLLTGRVLKFLKTTCALIGGLALSSIYFIPAFMERKYVHMGYLEDGPWGRYRDNFLFTMDKFHQDTSQFSHYYLLLHAGAIADLILFMFLLFIVKKRRLKPYKPIFVIFASFFVLAFILTTPLSKPLAYLIPGLSTLLFPYRWMAMMELALAFLGGYLFIETKIADKIRSCSFVLVYFFISAAIIWTTGMLSSETVKQFEYSAQSSYRMTPGIENIPYWAHNWLKLLTGPPPDPVVFVSGMGSHNVELWEPQKRIVRLSSSVPSRVRISTFYYPGWEAKLDGEKARIAIENPTGAMLIDMPQGNHVLKLIFAETWVRAVSGYLSFGCFVILAAISLFSLKNRVAKPSGK